MRWWTSAVFLGSAMLQAQIGMPIGITRGALVSWSGSLRAGELILRNTQNTAYNCSFDARTYFEREHQPAVISGFATGDPIEVVADRSLGSSTCYARIVQAVYKLDIRMAPVPAGRSPILITPRGDLTFGGLVTRRVGSLLTLKTRTGEVTVILRPDTRYAGNGAKLTREALTVNAHVFVRAGRNLRDEIEAYEVDWGDTVMRP